MRNARAKITLLVFIAALSGCANYGGNVPVNPWSKKVCKENQSPETHDCRARRSEERN